MAAIVLVLITRRVVVSLGAGLLVAALLLGDFAPIASAGYLGRAVLGLVWDSNSPNWYTILIVAFLSMLGILTSAIMMSGGAYAFTAWGATIMGIMAPVTLAAGLTMS